jgi:hypothetical protein
MTKYTQEQFDAAIRLHNLFRGDTQKATQLLYRVRQFVATCESINDGLMVPNFRVIGVDIPAVDGVEIVP